MHSAINALPEDETAKLMLNSATGIKKKDLNLGPWRANVHN